VQFADPDLRAMSTAFSILAWIGLVGQWARHVWTNRPEPVLCHAMVLLHLLAIVATEAMTLLWHCC
jgi:hypothetical protein